MDFVMLARKGGGRGGGKGEKKVKCVRKLVSPLIVRLCEICRSQVIHTPGMGKKKEREREKGRVRKRRSEARSEPWRLN